MAKIIKSMEGRQEQVSAYERDALERIVEAAFDDDETADPAQILARARAEAEDKVRQAYAEGLKRGQAAGEAAFRESVAGAADMLANAAVAMREAQEAFLEKIYPQVADLAMRVTRRILDRETQISSDVVLNTVRQALSRMADEERIVLRVNPEDLQGLREQRVTLLEQFDGVKQLEILADEEIARGGCRADSHALHIDGSLEAQLDTILAQLLEP